MIEKKRPIESDDLEGAHPLENDDLELHNHGAFQNNALNEETGYSDEHEDDYHDPENDIDLEAEAAARKRRGSLIFYGGAAVAIVAIGFIAYPQVKATFFKGAATHHAAAGVPVPAKARESKFTLAGTDTPKAPVAAIATPPGAMPAAGSATLSADPQPAPNIVAVAPPPVVVSPPPALPSQNMAQQTGVAPAPSPMVMAVPQAQPMASVPAKMPDMPAMQGDATQQAHLSDLDGKVTSLQGSIVALNNSSQQTADSLKQMQASLDALQKQIAAMGTAKAPASETHAVASVAAKPTHKTHANAGGSSNWTLRSATEGMALLGQPGSNDLKRVSVGDTVSGLGKILSISEQNGQWIVKGTSGSIVQ